MPQINMSLLTLLGKIWSQAVRNSSTYVTQSSYFIIEPPLVPIFDWNGRVKGFMEVPFDMPPNFLPQLSMQNSNTSTSLFPNMPLSGGPTQCPSPAFCSTQPQMPTITNSVFPTPAFSSTSPLVPGNFATNLIPLPYPYLGNNFTQGNISNYVNPNLASFHSDPAPAMQITEHHVNQNPVVTSGQPNPVAHTSGTPSIQLQPSTKESVDTVIKGAEKESECNYDKRRVIN